jgi:hypothetical protein
MDACTYGLMLAAARQPIPFRIFFWGGSLFEDRFERFGRERSFDGLRLSFSAHVRWGDPNFLHESPIRPP